MRAKTRRWPICRSAACACCSAIIGRLAEAAASIPGTDHERLAEAGRELAAAEAEVRAAEDAWSLDTYAAKDAPPTIIFSAADDLTTPPGHGISLFQAGSLANLVETDGLACKF